MPVLWRGNRNYFEGTSRVTVPVNTKKSAAAACRGRPGRAASAPQAHWPDGQRSRKRRRRYAVGPQLRRPPADHDQRWCHPGHRHPGDPWRVRAAGRSGDLDLLRHRRSRCAAVRRVLRRNGRPGPRGRLQLLLHLRHHGRGHGLDLRLVPRAGVRRLRGGCRRWRGQYVNETLAAFGQVLPDAASRPATAAS